MPAVRRIIGGHEAIPHSWPWQAALHWKVGFFVEPFCGGSLIADQWVLTAAHCVVGRTNPRLYHVRLGQFKIGSRDSKRVDIASVHIHPHYDPNSKRNDIAILKLQYRITYDKKISPICLPQTTEELPPKYATLYVTGWGIEDSKKFALIEGGFTHCVRIVMGQTSETLKEASIEMIDRNDCDKFYDAVNMKIDHRAMFCAGDQTGFSDSCHGDSGGPLMYLEYSTYRWKQYGIVSWGHGCAQEQKPGVYTNVVYYVDWIYSIVK
ncbi:unnamed protein product [Soboliphyme baturini]|uniref:Acrosin n=1 Tax=Soboliphyme baturini TaxID=241478 RepID=A0A183IPD7_9BILA|nr:unnamed protein product [Soboliphyme baturini]